MGCMHERHPSLDPTRPTPPPSAAYPGGLDAGLVQAGGAAGEGGLRSSKQRGAQATSSG